MTFFLLELQFLSNSMQLFVSFNIMLLLARMLIVGSAATLCVPFKYL